MSADLENASTSEAASEAGSTVNVDSMIVADATSTNDVKIVVASQDDEVEGEARGRTVRESYSDEEIRIMSEQQEEDDLPVRKWVSATAQQITSTRPICRFYVVPSRAHTSVYTDYITDVRICRLTGSQRVLTSSRVYSSSSPSAVSKCLLTLIQASFRQRFRTSCGYSR